MTALSSAARPIPRRLLAAVAALAYALPLMLAAMSDAGHGAFHIIERVRDRRTEAAALGVAHLASEGAYTHTHDGVTHSHAGVVDALLLAADEAEGDSDPVAPVVRLSPHAPATLIELVVGVVVTRIFASFDGLAAALPRALPPVPPPRA